jgi:hypothetical protein
LEFSVPKDSKPFIFSGGLFASAAIASTIVPSEDAVCLDNRLMCAPRPVQMGDLPSEDAPQPGPAVNAWIVTGPTSSYVMSATDLARSLRLMSR